jgi:hypothetical protein
VPPVLRRNWAPVGPAGDWAGPPPAAGFGGRGGYGIGSLSQSRERRGCTIGMHGTHYGQNRIQPMMSVPKDVSMDFFLNFPYAHLFFSLLNQKTKGFEAVWLSIAGECAKPNLIFSPCQINPVFWGVAFFREQIRLGKSLYICPKFSTISDNLYKVTFQI